MKPTTLGFALCGSFCTFSTVIRQMEQLTQQGYDLYPILSYNAYNLDTVWQGGGLYCAD